MSYKTYLDDCMRWMADQPEARFEAIVTDPPHGLREYAADERARLRENGRGGIWRIPPTLGGVKRAPLPRFTVLTQQELAELFDFFLRWGKLAHRVAVPGAHLFIATNTFLSNVLYEALKQARWEKRGEVVRLVQTLKGGDRPKNAEKEFSDVTVMPRSAWEPWGLFRKALDGRVQDNLRRWKTGGLRRESADRPFTDVIQSGRTPRNERQIVKHPSLKPQAFMRRIVRASLPLGIGRVLDPFMGGGSTIAAAEAVGYDSVGVEIDEHYLAGALAGIPDLARLYGGEEAPHTESEEEVASANGRAGHSPPFGERSEEHTLLPHTQNS